MKQRKYSIVLLIITALMLSMVFLLNKSNKESYKVKDISGDRKSLGDVSIVYTPYTSLFNHRSMVLNKDNLEIYENPKYIVERDYINIDKTNRKYIQSTTDECIYQNENNIGTLIIQSEFDEKNNSKNYIQIENKDLKSNKVKKIEIDLPKKYNKLYLTPSFTTIINDKVYTLLESYETSKVYIISIDLTNKNLIDLNEFRMSENDAFMNFNMECIRFYNDNKIYLEFQYQGKREYTNFLIYDIDTNTFTKSNEFMNKITSQGRYLSQNRFDYEVKDNKLSVLIGDNKGNIKTLVYDINQDNIKFNKEINHNLNLGYTQEDINSSKVKAKIIDNKIYTLYQPKTSLRSNYSEEFNYMMLEGVKPVILTVFDTVSNKIEYKSELFNGNANLINNLYMVKDY